MKRKPIALLMGLAVLLSGCSFQPASSQPGSPASLSASDPQTSSDASQTPDAPDSQNAPDSAADEQPEKITLDVQNIKYLVRPSLLARHYEAKSIPAPAAVSFQTPADDLSNVYFGAHFFTDQAKQKLAENGFVLEDGFRNEFFEVYEDNRYSYRANYVTVDSMMHTYHLYFAYLLKKLERGRLSAEMLDVSRMMMETAQSHYAALQGTEWEEAAKTELAYFAVGCSLLDPETAVPDAVSGQVQAELSAINAASGIEYSNVFSDIMEDYSQYIPRGYYDGSEDLKRYFKAMMWYGRMGFAQDKETLNRASVLITLDMQGEAFQKWEMVYDVTSFFAGAADDLTYYEIKPAIDAAYGQISDVSALVGKDAEWNNYQALCQELPVPAINSIPISAAASDEEYEAAQRGFRFMGQRFSIDAASYSQLTYRQVKENEAGQKRLLPDALDFPAALGSDTALSILENSGKTNYPNFGEQMDKVRNTVSGASVDSWTANLYSAWIYTLMPMIENKDASYPPLMQTDAWRRKNLLSFEGSYTELKHDTVLYSKQMMGEMGGGPEETPDDRGYVEAEPVVFARLQSLVDATSAGLSDYGVLDDKDRSNMQILSDLSGKLGTIAQKELSGELPSDEEFELIRTIGGQLEHFWEEVMDAEYPDEQFHSTSEHPAAIVTDIATDPNGFCLEVGTGSPMTISAVVEVDGQLRVASGPVYSFYQFEQPLSDRLTDSKWRAMLGIEPNASGSYEQDPSVTYPAWYSDLVYDWRSAY